MQEKVEKKQGQMSLVAVHERALLTAWRAQPIVSKWTRAEMALNGGIDLVIELPYAFATEGRNICKRIYCSFGIARL